MSSDSSTVLTRYYWRLCNYPSWSQKFTTVSLSNVRMSNSVWKIGFCGRLLICWLFVSSNASLFLESYGKENKISQSSLFVNLHAFEVNGSKLFLYILQGSYDPYSSCAKPPPSYSSASLVCVKYTVTTISLIQNQITALLHHLNALSQ